MVRGVSKIRKNADVVYGWFLIKYFFSQQAIDEASLDFVDVLMAKVKTSPEIPDMLEELKKFFAEVTGIVLFGLRLGAIQENLEACSEIATLMSEVEKINDRILQTDGPIYPKDAYIKIKESQVNGIISLILAHRTF